MSHPVLRAAHRQLRLSRPWHHALQQRRSSWRSESRPPDQASMATTGHRIGAGRCSSDVSFACRAKTANSLQQGAQTAVCGCERGVRTTPTGTPGKIQLVARTPSKPTPFGQQG